MVIILQDCSKKNTIHKNPLGILALCHLFQGDCPFILFFYKIRYLIIQRILLMHRLCHVQVLSWQVLYRAVHLPDRSC